MLRKKSAVFVVCCCLVTKSCPTLLWPCGLHPARHLCPWDFPGKNTRVGCHFLLWGIFLTQRLNPCLLHWRASLVTQLVKNPPAMQETWFDPLQYSGLENSMVCIVHGIAKSRARLSGFHFHFTFSCLDRQILYHWATCKAWSAVYVEANGPAMAFLEIYPRKMSADVHRRHGQECSKQFNSKSPRLATTLRSTTE